VPPQHTKVEKEDSHEHIVCTHPQGVALQVKHIPNQREENHHPMQTLYLLYEINKEVGDKERKQEPGWSVAVETACLPDVFPNQRLDRLVIPVEQEGQECKVNRHSYQAGRYIGNKDSPCPIHDVILCPLASDAFVEVAGLEEEERHEVETPLHNMLPPIDFSQSAEVHDVEAYHTNDAKPTQEVEHMISLFHSAKIQKNE
jgi:hypothetical protein